VGQGGTVKAEDYNFFHQLGIGFFVYHRIVSAVDSSLLATGCHI